MKKRLTPKQLKNVTGGTTYLSSNTYYVVITPILSNGGELANVKSVIRSSVLDINKVRDTMIRQIFKTNANVSSCSWAIHCNDNGCDRVISTGKMSR